MRGFGLIKKDDFSKPQSNKKKYSVIVVDPPWEISKIKRRMYPNQQELAYPTLTIEKIKSINISSIADKNAILFLWTIDKYLYSSIEILKSWEFNYHCTMVWNKIDGMSIYGFRRCTEFIIVGFKGHHEAYPKRKNIPTSFSSKSTGHSTKPQKFYRLLKHLKGNKIDIFSRRKRKGWDVYGNEVDSDVSLNLDFYKKEDDK